MKRALIAFAITVFSVVSVTGVLAADLTVTCATSDGCKTSGDTPFFLSENISSDFTITKQIKAVNEYEEARQFAIELVGSNFDDSTPSLADKLEIKIAKTGNINLLYGPKKISGWKNDGYVILTTIPANHSEEYNLTVSLKGVGSDYQSKEIKFDLAFGFEAVPAVKVETQITEAVTPVLKNLTKVLGLSATSASEATQPATVTNQDFRLLLLLLLLLVVLLIWWGWHRRQLH